jgi:hypothetical protein
MGFGQPASACRKYASRNHATGFYTRTAEYLGTSMIILKNHWFDALGDDCSRAGQ